MSCRERLETYLRSSQVPFEVHVHKPAYTAQGVAEHEHIPGQMMVKVVLVVADGALVMLALPTSRRVDLARVSALLDAREVRLASEHEMVGPFMDCELGAMPPFGSLYGLPVYADRSLEDDETIYFQAGTHEEAISMSYADYKRLVAPTVAEFTHTQGRPAERHVEHIRETGGW